MNLSKVCLVFLFCTLCLANFATAEERVRSATVVSVESASNYLILLLEEGDDQLWAAANPFAVEVGDEVEYLGGVPMSEFYVKSLDQTFKRILFLTNIRHKLSDEEKAALIAEKAAAEVAAEKGAAEQAASPPDQPSALPQDDYHKNMSVEQAQAAPSADEMIGLMAELSIAELFAQREDLAGQVVKVRGKAMKVSKNILGRTWVTLSDGSGSAPNDMLRITSVQEDVEVGDMLAAAGTVKINVDLGAGYSYPVILEDATFSHK